MTMKREAVVKMPPLRMTGPTRPVPRAVVLACWAALSSTMLSHAMAQDAVLPGMEGEAVPRSGMWVEPRITTGVTLTNNGTQATSNPTAEQVLEVTPGVRVVMNRPRAKGFVDYSLSALHHAQGTSGDNFRNALNANLTLEAVRERAYVDVSGVIADEAVSAFGPQSIARSDVNRSETSSFRVSPFIRGELGTTSYELRYSAERLNTDINTRSDITVQDLSLRMRSDLTGQTLGWSLDASSLSADYSLGRSTRSDQVQGGLIYVVSPQLTATFLAGVEANNVITLTREKYNTTGLNLDWRPSDRSRLEAGIQKRYFGTGHHLAFEHRSGRTVWRINDTRDVINNPLDSKNANLGSIYGQLDTFYSLQYPDPVERSKVVEAELLRRGLPSNATTSQDFLSSSALLERAQSVSVALIGIRDVVTFALTRSTSRRLDPAITLGDDFDGNERIQQRSWGLNYSHRLTPLTTTTVGLGQQKTTGLVSGLDTRLTSFSVGLTTRLAPRTSGIVQIMRAIYDRIDAPYRETAISAFITHRF